MTVAELETVVEGITKKALHHKKLAGYHRQKTQALYARAEKLRSRLAQMGVAVRCEGEISHGTKESPRSPD